ncbi:carboxypeptidase regulatory-like domain-containing protein [Candidatus Woesearchaeota archaeon]|nr:carboxypeptidase regulatory-like domain-containing protein [Candidatus Woesearchaeota archaeon]
MKKRGVISVVVISIFVIFIASVYAQLDEVCYTIDVGQPCARSADCAAQFGGDVKKIVTGGDTEYSACEASLGCCCFGETNAAIFSEEVCKPAFLEDASFNGAITSPTTCTFFCRGEIPTCTYTLCDGVNSITPCKCGTVQVDSSSLAVCCAQDNVLFPSVEACLSDQASACKAEIYTISGTVTDQDGDNLAGVTIAGGGDTFTTSDTGTYQLDVRGQNTYTVQASKFGYESAQANVEVLSADVLGVDFTLIIKPEQQDSDGDGVNDFEDACPYEAMIQNADDSSYREFEELGFCRDGIDNDCDKLIDCQDPGCVNTDEQCSLSYCGDGIVEFNVEGIDEECDAKYDDAGTKISGIDNLCPGQCITEGVNRCRCPAVCGDDRHSRDLEQCDIVDGITVGCPGEQECWSSSDPLFDPAKYTLCTCKPISICGDHLITGNEECDFNEQQEGFDKNGVLVNCILPGNAGECTIRRSVCGNGVLETPWEDCELTSQANVGGLCSVADCSQCQCPQTCFNEQSLPIIETLEVKKASYDISLTWSSRCVPSSYTVFRCEGDCTSSNMFVVADKTIQTSVVDTFSKNQLTKYCYVVRAHFFDVDIAKSLDSVQKCVMTGDELCSKPTQPEFCNSNIRSTCNATNNLVGVEVDSDLEGPDCGAIPSIAGETYICLGPDEQGDTECVMQAECGECNGLLGMFYRQGCAIDKRLLPREVCVDCSILDSCYVDFSLTSVDKYYSCSQATSCYDYKSQQTCQEDPCSIGEGARSDCEWIETDYGEVGFGVCRPVDIDEQNCAKCNEPFNSVFGACDRELCSLYGACYYDFDILQQSHVCKHKSEVSCEDYDSIQDCTGGVNVEVDISYDLSEDQRDCASHVFPDDPDECKVNKSAGTNAIVKRSNDYFGFGTCKWVQTGSLFSGASFCVKDADNKTNIDLLYTGDCALGDSTCSRDFEAPSTTVEIPAFVGGNSRLVVSTIDNVYDTVYTYFGVAPRGSFSYPRIQAYDSRIDIADAQLQSSGDYTIYYFSEDLSHNIEQVKSFDVFIDAEPPVVTIETSKNSYLSTTPQGTQIFLTDLSVTLSVSDDTFDASTCSANLTKNSQVLPNGYWLNEALGDGWTHLFVELPDERYVLKYACLDGVGNLIEGERVVVIDADNSITNPLPHGPVRERDLTLSVETSEDAECRYSDVEVPLGPYLSQETFLTKMTRFGSTGGKYHTSNVNVIGPDNMSVRYYVRCKFPDNSFRGTGSDDIKFAIDRQPPKVWLEVNEQQTQLAEWYYLYALLKVKCEDPAIFVNGENMAFDDCEVKFCPGETCTPFETGKSVWPWAQSSIGEDLEAYFGYSAFDKGGNEVPVQRNSLKIDGKQPEFRIEIWTFAGEQKTVVTKDSYFVKIVPTEELSQIVQFQFIVGGQTFDVPVAEAASEEYFWWGRMDLQEFSDIEANATFKLVGNDSHGVLGDVITSGESFVIDTKAPEEPVIEPELSTYTHLVNDIYYTNQDNIHVSGYTTEAPLQIQFDKDDELRHTFIQTVNEPKAELRVLSGSLDTKLVKFTGDVTGTISVGDYLEFQNHFRRTYPFYKQFYRVAAVQFVVGSIQTEVTLESNLEDNVNNVMVKIYNAPLLTNWFTQQYSLTDTLELPGGATASISTGDINMSTYALDFAGNPSGKVSYQLLLDKAAPQIVDYGPKDGWVINDQRVSVFLNATEFLQGSGFDASTSVYVIDDVQKYYYDTKITFDESYEYGHFTYGGGAQVLAEQLHTVNFSVKDNAGNEVSKDWSFEINTDVPSTPYFQLANALVYGDLRFTKNLPERYYLRFAQPVDVDYFTTSLGECSTSDFKNFECNITEISENDDGKYRVSVEAAKQGFDVVGKWWFEFVYDTVEPEVNLDYSHTTRSGVSFNIDAFTLNEEYDTVSYLELQDVRILMPLVSVDLGENSNYHSYEWVVPEELPEGAYEFNVTMTDRANNSKTLVGTFTVDNTPPDIGILEIIADNIYFRDVDGERIYYTSDPVVTVVGNISSIGVTSDIANIVYKFPARAPLQASIDTAANTYTIEIPLLGGQGLEFVNTVRLEAFDTAKNVEVTEFKVIYDLRAPHATQTLISEP